MNKFVLYNTQEEYTLSLEHLINVKGLRTYGYVPSDASYLPGYFRWSDESNKIYYGSKHTFDSSYPDTPREDIYVLKLKTVAELERQEPSPEIIEIKGVEFILSDVVKAIQQADLTPWNEPKDYADGLPC